MAAAGKKDTSRIKGQRYRVCYGSDKYVCLVCVLVILIPGFVGAIAAFLTVENGAVILLMFAAIALICILGLIYAFRFRVVFSDNKRGLEVRKLFGGQRSVPLDDIREIYKSTDGKVDFLNIVTSTEKLHVNTAACENADMLEVFLRAHKGECFVSESRKEYHLL